MQSVAADSTWVLPPTSWWSTVDMPLPREVGSDSTAALDLPVPAYTVEKVSEQLVGPARLVATYPTTSSISFDFCMFLQFSLFF